MGLRVMCQMTWLRKGADLSKDLKLLGTAVSSVWAPQGPASPQTEMLAPVGPPTCSPFP